MNSGEYTYVWERPAWPELRWDEGAVSRPLASVRHAQGRLLGRMEALGFDRRDEAVLETLTEDVLTTSAIEGERLDGGAVRSSVARHLGLEAGGLAPADRAVEGIVEVTLDATRNAHLALGEDRLLGWQAALFPDGRSGLRRVRTGVWRDDRDGPMQVVSGRMGRERVHYQAPPAERVALEMARFLAWFNAPADTDPVLKAAVAHLWFITIHPFEDGNGRIARAIADLALTRSEGVRQRFYSMSAQIRAERNDYYAILEATQRGDGDITDWMLWFLACLGRSIEGAAMTLARVTAKAAFWERHAGDPLTDRQIRVLNRLLDGFEGRLTSSKWAALGKCSQDSAGRDIAALMAFGILRRGDGGGRSTHYELVLPGSEA
jgi:Fic family protein